MPISQPRAMTSPAPSEAILCLGVTLDGQQFIIADSDACEDFQTLLLLKAERAAERGEQFDHDYFRYQASQVGCLFSALKQGAMLPQPSLEI